MSLPPFFGGSGSNLGIVRALSPQTFAEFVKETLGNPAVIRHMTRREFLARDKKDRDEIKRVAFFVPSVHRGSPVRRAFETAAYCNLICVDIDVEKDGTAPAKPFVDDPNILRDNLRPYAFAAYKTAASTPEKPRLRVVVKADRIPLDMYPQAVQYVGAKLLNLPIVTPESRVSVQPMFLPTLFCDDDAVHQHPLIAAVPEGAAITVQIVAGVAVPSERPKTDSDPEDLSLESLAFLRPQVDGITADDVREAMEHLDPDCGYNEWISAAAALKHQFGDDGFDLFLEWSAKGEKYTSEEDTRQKWDSFRANPRGRLPVTIRSLLKKAAEAGWNHSEAIATRCYQECRAWLTSRQTAQALMDEGVSRIAGLPFISDIQRNALIADLCDALKRVGVAVTKSELKKSYNKFERQLAKISAAEKQLKATPDSEMPEWARGFCYVATQDQFFQRHTGRKLQPASFDRFYSVQLMTKADDGSSVPAVRPSDFLLNTLTCPRVDDYAYDPGQSEAIFRDGSKRVVNLYIPTHPEPDPARAQAAGEILQHHVNVLIREPEYRQIWMDFMAYLVQYPGRKVRWVPLLQGVHGCGKTTLMEVMRAVLGREHVRQIGPESVLDQRNNGWAFGSQLVAVEEIRVVGHNRHDVMNKLKPCITNDYIDISDKWVVPFQTRNYTNYMMFSNYQDALAISKDERRYFVVFSDLQSKQQVAALGKDYFPNLYFTIQNEAGGLRSFLENWKISERFEPEGQAIVTPYMEEMARVACSPLQAAIHEAIYDNRHILVQPDLLSFATLCGLMELDRRVPKFTDQSVAAILRELGYIKNERIGIDGTYHILYTHRSAVLDGQPAEVARRRLAAADSLEG